MSDTNLNRRFWVYKNRRIILVRNLSNIQSLKNAMTRRLERTTNDIYPPTDRDEIKEKVGAIIAFSHKNTGYRFVCRWVFLQHSAIRVSSRYNSPNRYTNDFFFSHYKIQAPEWVRGGNFGHCVLLTCFRSVTVEQLSGFVWRNMINFVRHCVDRYFYLQDKGLWCFVITFCPTT